MRIVLTKTNNDTVNVDLSPNDPWFYEIQFDTNPQMNEAVLNVINAEQVLLQHPDILQFFYTIREIDVKDVANVQLYDVNNQLCFDAVDLMLEYEGARLEYISDNSSLTRPGVGTMFMFRFKNNYINNGSNP